MHAKAGRTGGLTTKDWNSIILKSTCVNDKLHFYLSMLFEKGENFPIEILSVEEIGKRHSIF